jgi:hypothetical protein
MMKGGRRRKREEEKERKGRGKFVKSSTRSRILKVM